MPGHWPFCRVFLTWERPPRDHLWVLTRIPGMKGGGRGVQYRVAGWGSRAAAGAGTGAGGAGGLPPRAYRCFTVRADALFEVADAVLCAGGPVKTLAGLSLTPEHRRGHGALYDAVNCGEIAIGRLRRSLAGLPLPRAADGRLMLAADVSSWLRPGAVTSPD